MIRVRLPERAMLVESRVVSEVLPSPVFALTTIMTRNESVLAACRMTVLVVSIASASRPNHRRLSPPTPELHPDGKTDAAPTRRKAPGMISAMKSFSRPDITVSRWPSFSRKPCPAGLLMTFSV